MARRSSSERSPISISASTKKRSPSSVGSRPGRGVRRIDEAELLEVRHHVAHRRGRQRRRDQARDVARADGLAGGEIALDDLTENLARALVELREAHLASSRSGRRARPRPTPRNRFRIGDLLGQCKRIKRRGREPNERRCQSFIVRRSISSSRSSPQVFCAAFIIAPRRPGRGTDPACHWRGIGRTAAPPCTSRRTRCPTTPPAGSRAIDVALRQCEGAKAVGRRERHQRRREPLARPCAPPRDCG